MNNLPARLMPFSAEHVLCFGSEQMGECCVFLLTSAGSYFVPLPWSLCSQPGLEPLLCVSLLLP